MDDSTARSRHREIMRQSFLWALLLTILLVLHAPIATYAQEVVTNITSTTGAGDLGTTVTQSGNLYDITGGTRPGNGLNLFHSFGDFSLGTVAGVPDIANFLNNNTGLQTSNIISRVTGGNISNIYGTIQTTDFGSANLFLVNPSGIVFGPNGSVNVGGSVSFTTAQYIRLLDDAFSSANFYANPANDGLANSILAIDPGAFGFLSANPNAYGFLTAPNPDATITVQGSTLSVPSGQSISLVGGKVDIQGGAQLSAPEGRIHLATTASPGEFASSPFESLANATTLESSPNNPVDPASATSFSSFGKVSLAPGSSIDVHGTSMVLIKGGQLVLSVNDATLNTSENSAQSNTISLSQGSSNVTFNSGTDLGVDVQLTASDVSLNGTAINTQTDGAEPGGNITVTADRVTLDRTRDNFARIVTGSGGEGAAGNVIIQGPEEAKGVATSVTLSDLSEIGSSISGSGAGGEIAITAESLDLYLGSSIVSSTNGSASNGAIVVSVRDATLTGGSTFASDTAFSGEGVVGGKITVQGLDGEGSKAASLILEGPRSGLTAKTFGTGKLGDIEVHAETLRMTDGAAIESGSPLDTASAGTITIKARVVDILDESRISSHTFNLDAGPVNITADQFSLDNSTIATDTSSGTSGLGGEVILNVASASLTNGATINSSASNTGFAGNIKILASGSVTMTNGSTITASTSGTGDAGQVIVTTPTVSLNDANITTSTSGTGNAGSIAITTTGNSLSLANGSTISSTSTEKAAVPNPDGLTTEPPGTAGNVTITATGSFTSDASSIATSAEANHGGDISITAESVQLSNGTKIDASSNAPLEVTKLVLEIDENGNPVLDENGQPKLVTVLVGDGNAGNVTIISDSNVVMQNSSVTTEASQASGGSIEINASDTGMIQLVNSKVSTSVKGVGGGSDGGNISIDPQFVILQNSQLVAQANAGAGGAINVIAKVFIADPNSLVSASSQSGPQGTVNIQSPVQNVGGELSALSQEFSSVGALLAQQCAARAADGKFSTFVIAAREGLPAEPGGFLASPSLTSELFGSRLSGQVPQTQLSAVTGLFPKYDARPIQLAKLGNACR